MNWKKSTILRALPRLSLGILFGLAGGGKLWDFSGFSELANSWNILPVKYVAFFAQLLIVIELSLSVMLVANLLTRCTGALAILLLLLFTVFLLILPQLVGGASPCGCFQISVLQKYEQQLWFGVTRNIGMLGLAILALRISKTPHEPSM